MSINTIDARALIGQKARIDGDIVGVITRIVFFAGGVEVMVEWWHGGDLKSAYVSIDRIEIQAK